MQMPPHSGDSFVDVTTAGIADQASRIAKFRTATMSDQQVTTQLSLGNPNPEKKLIHNAELGLIVSTATPTVGRQAYLGLADRLAVAYQPSSNGCALRRPDDFSVGAAGYRR
jgi:hypothetical protein